MSVVGTSPVIKADWSVIKASEVRVGDEIFGYGKGESKTSQSKLISTTVTGVEHTEGSTCYKIGVSGLSSMYLSDHQGIWMDRIKNGKIWMPPVRSSSPSSFVRAETLRAGHHLRGAGNCLYEPWGGPIEINPEKWLEGYNAPDDYKSEDTLERKDADGDKSSGFNCLITPFGLGKLSKLFEKYGVSATEKCQFIVQEEATANLVVALLGSMRVNTTSVTERGKTKIVVEGSPLSQVKFLSLINRPNPYLSNESSIRKGIILKCFIGVRLTVGQVTSGESASAFCNIQTSLGNFISSGFIVRCEEFE